MIDVHVHRRDRPVLELVMEHPPRRGDRILLEESEAYVVRMVTWVNAMDWSAERDHILLDVSREAPNG